MRFPTIAACTLLATLVSADDPILQKDVEIQNLWVHNVNNAVDGAGFLIKTDGVGPNGVNCTGEAKDFQIDSAISCHNPPAWSFRLKEKDGKIDQYTFTVYLGLGQFAGIWSQANITMDCHKGVGPVDDHICNQKPDPPLTMTLTQGGPPILS